MPSSTKDGKRTSRCASGLYRPTASRSATAPVHRRTLEDIRSTRSNNLDSPPKHRHLRQFAEGRGPRLEILAIDHNKLYIRLTAGNNDLHDDARLRSDDQSRRHRAEVVALGYGFGGVRLIRKQATLLTTTGVNWMRTEQDASIASATAIFHALMLQAISRIPNSLGAFLQRIHRAGL